MKLGDIHQVKSRISCFIRPDDFEFHHLGNRRNLTVGGIRFNGRERYLTVFSTETL